MNLKYDRQEAIQNATRLFWEKGYQATKMRDIQVALDMRPGSIYAGFGNKLGLFATVVDAYTQASLVQFDAIEKAAKPLRELTAFFECTLRANARPAYEKQCLLARCLQEISGSDAQAEKLVTQGLKQAEQALEKILRAAIKAQELPQNLDIEAAAKWCQQQLMGMRSYALLSNDDRDVDAAITHVFNYLPHIVKPVQ